VTLGSENTVAIEKSVEAGKEETIDVPFSTGAIASANFRIILTVNGNVDSLTLELAADMCLKLNEMELCGGLIPTCTDSDDFSSLGDQANVAKGLANTFCTASGNFNMNKAFGSPPYEFLQLSAISFADICSPGATVVNVITFKATIAGTVDDFDEEAFKTNLASGLVGIQPTDITVSAAPGSVVVTSEIVTSVAAVADSTMAYLAAANETSLTDLLQVTVTAVEPPSQTSSAGGSTSGGGPGGILGGIFGTLGALAAIAAVYVFFKKAKKKIEPLEEAPAAEDAETPPN